MILLLLEFYSWWLDLILWCYYWPDTRAFMWGCSVNDFIIVTFLDSKLLHAISCIGSSSSLACMKLSSPFNWTLIIVIEGNIHSYIFYSQEILLHIVYSLASNQVLVIFIKTYCSEVGAKVKLSPSFTIYSSITFKDLSLYNYSAWKEPLFNGN